MTEARAEAIPIHDIMTFGFEVLIRPYHDYVQANQAVESWRELWVRGQGVGGGEYTINQLNSCC